MNRNPLIPFGLIAGIGIILMFTFSFVGLDNMKEMAQADEGGAVEEKAADATPEEIFAGSCASCHGQNLEGAVGPALDKVGGKYSAAEIEDIIINGKGTMPPGMAGPEEAKKLAEWLAEKK